MFLDQEEDALDREYGGIAQSHVFLVGTASDLESSSKLLNWDDIDQVKLSSKVQEILQDCWTYLSSVWTYSGK